MDQQGLVDAVNKFAPQIVQYVLMGMGGLVILGRVYIATTPTKNDDNWLQALESKPIIGGALRVLAYFSPVARK